MKTHKKNIGWVIRDKKCTILPSKEKILERWAELYEELYKADVQTCTVIPISIHAKFLKVGGDILVNVLEKFFNSIVRTGQISATFKEAHIVILYKKDDKSDCKIYRPINLVRHISQLFMTFIGARITNALYFFFHRSQAAYQQGRGTTEQISSLCQLIEKSI